MRKPIIIDHLTALSTDIAAPRHPRLPLRRRRLPLSDLPQIIDLDRHDYVSLECGE